RYIDHLPDGMRPQIGASNAEELISEKQDSGYIISVARQDESVGRSATAQNLHGSETAFWNDLPIQMSSILQVVPDIDNSEIVLESTANGFNDFNALWTQAQAGANEFQPIFLPWFVDREYRRKVDDSFEASPEERELAELYGLDDAQLNWRRNK